MDKFQITATEEDAARDEEEMVTQREFEEGEQQQHLEEAAGEPELSREARIEMEVMREPGLRGFCGRVVYFSAKHLRVLIFYFWLAVVALLQNAISFACNEDRYNPSACFHEGLAVATLVPLLMWALHMTALAMERYAMRERASREVLSRLTAARVSGAVLAVVVVVLLSVAAHTNCAKEGTDNHRCEIIGRIHGQTIGRIAP